MINFTIQNFEAAKQITKECFSWCKQQHFYEMQNIVQQDIAPLIIAFAALVIFYITSTYTDFILKHTDLKEKHLMFVSENAFFFALYLLAIYAIYLSFFAS